ncbi:MAG: hypothetical protein JOZ93_09815 [Sinobacteraceae bacterium]|nr:hypothetical protein [Nevskiaceae bacterium]
MPGRASGRAADEMSQVRFTRGFTHHAEGSVLVEFGATRVLCTASVEDSVPPFLRGKAQGWVTAEYGMLPRSTHTRSPSGRYCAAERRVITPRQRLCAGWPPDARPFERSRRG